MKTLDAIWSCKRGSATTRSGGTRVRENCLESISMINARVLCLMTLGLAIAMAPRVAAQVQTDVPPVVAGTKPVAVEHIKVHGAVLEGNLEGDAVDRDVLVFLP